MVQYKEQGRQWEIYQNPSELSSMRMRTEKSLSQTGSMGCGTLWGANASLPELPVWNKAIMATVSL